MTRSQLALILLDLVQRNAITPEEMVEVLRRFDAGDLEEDELPLSVSLDAKLSGQRDDWMAALALLLILLNSEPGLSINKLQSKQAQKLLRRQFEADTQRAGIQVASGVMAIVAWQRSIQASLSNYTRQMAVAGAGKIPSASTQGTVEGHLTTQWPYLEQFAAQIMARNIGQRPMSAEWIAARSAQYGATGWGAYFAGQGDEAAWGWVDRWNSRDDRATCYVCRPRHGQYFLPSQDPYPGWDCLGSCRCNRVREYNPQVYLELIG